MNIPIPDNGTPVQPGDTHFVYKNVYHPITWINDLPYRPRVETLVIKDGETVYMRIKGKDKGSSGNKNEYELPGGSIDADSTPIEQAENETHEEALISIKNIYDTGIQYYDKYPSGFIMNGGDTPLEYEGHISNIFAAEYAGIYDKSRVEDKDLDPGIADNGKFYRIVEVVKFLRKEHIDALLSCPFVKTNIKGSIRILDKLYNKETSNTKTLGKTDITGELLIVSKYDNLTNLNPRRSYGKQLHITSAEKIVRVFSSVNNALAGFDTEYGNIRNDEFMYVYAIDDDSVKLYNPTNEESPSAKLTGEMWIKSENPVPIKRLGMIRVAVSSETDKFYYGKNSVFTGEIPRTKYTWVIKDVTKRPIMESNAVVPGNKLYHGSTYVIDEFKPMSLDLGNVHEEPGWSTFAFADYDLALRFGLMRSIQKVKDYYGEKYKDVVCSWDIIEGKPYISAKDFKLICNLIKGFKFYVYTIDATNLDVGIGNDDRLPEYTFRESGVIPEKTDALKIDEMLINNHLLIIPESKIKNKIRSQEKMAKYHHIRGWYSTMMTRDYNNGSASAALQKAVSDGKLNPGDDIRKYMNENCISFENDSVTFGEVTENFIFSSNNLYINYEAFKNGTSNTCLVTGLSGSGKTTLGSKIANENNAELIELDMFEHCYAFENDDQLKECGQVFYDYLSSHKDIWKSLKNKSLHGTELGAEIDKFVKYCISWCKQDKKNKYVIEGVQIYSFLSKKDLGNTPIIFVGTSALKSIIRRMKRTKSESKDDFKRELSELPQCIAWYIDEEKSYKSFKKAVLESTEYNSEESNEQYGLLESAEYSETNKYPVFVILMHTGTTLSTVIKNFTHDIFSHAAVSFNSKLSPMYSFGTKKLGTHDHGFTQHEIDDPFYRAYKTRYSVYVMYVTKDQQEKMTKRLNFFKENEDTLKYGVVDLIACAMKVPTEFRKKYFCSRFVMEILGQGVPLDKVPSLWTPQQISTLDNISLVNSGYDLKNYNYRVTENNLTLIKKGKFDEITVQELVTENFEFAQDNSYINNEEKSYVCESSDASKMKKGFKTKKSKNFKFISISDPNADKYLLQNSECKKDIENIHKTRSGEIVINTEDDKLAGYCFVFKNAEWKGYISPLVVIKKYRGYGLSNTLIEHAIRKYGGNKLFVTKDNEVAINLYKKYGFKIIEKDENDKPTASPQYFFMILESLSLMESSLEEFGLPELRKYPLDTKDHVLSAIKFFNYVDPENEKELAHNILSKLDEYDITPHVTTRNRFSKYISESSIPFDKTDTTADWSIVWDLPRDERSKILKLSAKYMNCPVVYTNSLVIDNQIAGVLHIFRDFDDDRLGHIFNIIRPEFRYIHNINESLLWEAQCELTNITTYDIDYIVTDYTSIPGHYLPIGMCAGDIQDAEEISANGHNSEIKLFNEVQESKIINLIEARENNPIEDSYIPLMEAPKAIDEDGDGDTPQDYTEDAQSNNSNADDSTQIQQDEPTDYTEDANNDDDQVNEDDKQDGTEPPQEEEEPTDYTNDAETSGENDETALNNESDEDPSESTSNGGNDGNGNLFDNNVLKNYSLLKNFEKLYELTKEVSDSLDSKVMPTKLQNTVLAQVLKNLSSIKEFILSYVKFQFSEDNYSQNLYYYNIVMQSLKLNLELLKRNKELEKKEQ